MTVSHPMLLLFERWVADGRLRAVDRALARFLLDLHPEASDTVLLAAALVSYQLGQGRVYLDLAAVTHLPVQTLGWTVTEGDWVTLEEGHPIAERGLDDWFATLKTDSKLVAEGEGNSPLVLDGRQQRLYLRRYWQYQQRVTEVLKGWMNPVRSVLSEAIISDINRLFPVSDTRTIDWQKVACVLALRSRFGIITGGPGTGKTTTLTKLLVLLIRLAEEESPLGRPLNIVLAAPTGKAAARVSESINSAIDTWVSDESIRAQMPRKASTLHRLLGTRPGSRQFRYHRHQPLVADVVVVDEASMVDLEMMAALLDAMPESATLILLGDKDQLASVEPGSVLGDLCQGAGAEAYDVASRDWIERYAGFPLSQDSSGETGFSPYVQQTTVLRHSYRFDDASGIGHLAKAVNAGDVMRVKEVLTSAPACYPDLTAGLTQEILRFNPRQQLQRLVSPESSSKLQGYQLYQHLLNERSRYPSQDAWALAVLAAFDTFRVLTPLRRGIWGVEGLNPDIEKWLGLSQSNKVWYPGRPVMVTGNDYDLNLMNGDIGIQLTDDQGRDRVAFPAGDHKIHWVSPLRLPNVETAFAMTVHKSQGSEFSHVVLVLPEKLSPVLGRELVYTGITRAKQDFTLLQASSGILEQAVVASCRKGSET